MVGDGKVRAGKVVDGDTSGADQVEDERMVMSGESDVLNEIEAFKHDQKFCGYSAVCGSHVHVEINQEQNGK